MKEGSEKDANLLSSLVRTEVFTISTGLRNVVSSYKEMCRRYRGEMMKKVIGDKTYEIDGRRRGTKRYEIAKEATNLVKYEESV